jgi:hypothetical protein
LNTEMGGPSARETSSDIVAGVGTIISRNHAPAARVLAESLAEHHPELQLTVLVVDAELFPLDGSAEPFEVVTPRDLGIEQSELHELASMYNPLELCEALKPRLLQHLLKVADVGLYVDSDIEFFSRIDDLIHLAASHSILLTPQMTEPMPRDGLFPHDKDQLSTGIFNAGFLAVGRGATSFLDWWARQLTRYCIHDFVHGVLLFGDQLWLNYVPCFFEYAITRDPGCNVAWWNLGPRKVERNDEGVYLVNGSRLRFFHYSLFDPDVPGLIHTWGPDRPHRAQIASEYPEVAALCRRYAARLMERGYREESRIPYGFGQTAAGPAFEPFMRRTCRSVLLGLSESDGSRIPSPFSGAEASEFLRWLREPAPGPAPIARYLKCIYDERLDLREAFPEVELGDSDRFLEWVRGHGAAEESIPPELIP